MWGWFGGGRVIFFLHFMLFPTSLEKIILGIKNKIFFCLEKTIVDIGTMGIYIQYIYRKTTIVVLASEPVGGRSRATELPCFFYSSAAKVSG